MLNYCHLKEVFCWRLNSFSSSQMEKSVDDLKLDSKAIDNIGYKLVQTWPLRSNLDGCLRDIYSPLLRAVTRLY